MFKSHPAVMELTFLGLSLTRRRKDDRDKISKTCEHLKLLKLILKVTSDHFILPIKKIILTAD